MSRSPHSSMDQSSSGNMLSSRMKQPLGIYIGPQRSYANNNTIIQEVVPVQTAILPFVEKTPNYTTWVFLDRNQRFAEDQSVVNPLGSQALIISDNEERTAEPAPKHEFSEAENRIISMVCKKYEPSEEVLKLLTQFINGTTSEIQAAYNMLKNRNSDQDVSGPGEAESDTSLWLDNSLPASLDSYDKLFCRQCLVFDCRLHGYSQPVITPLERQRLPLGWLENWEPCSDQCYLQLGPVLTFLEKRGGFRNTDDGIAEEPWKTLEKELYLTGLEMFGRNCCSIAKNLLFGIRTCIEVFAYMQDRGSAVSQDTSDNVEGAGVGHTEQETPSTSGLLRRNKAKKPKSSAAHASALIRFGNEKQYTPCECTSVCGNQCICVENEICCEKFCGCSKSCKNRFRGCHCGKGQCRSRQCPCFVAARECDPDVCQNCWVSCGDGSLGEPAKRGEGPCANMRLLLRQKQRILLGKSDVAGWGAFARNDINKDDYLGEYTGEIMTHEEADKRVKSLDSKDRSYMFNLNNQYVVDALRKGNKLKFANHSWTPNCYAKIILVGGDHRVAIFAKEQIQAGDELFYDYCFGPDQTPDWAKKPDGSMGAGGSGSKGQTKKHQSHR